MSERTRAKEALRLEVNTYTGENVRKIAATAAVAEEDRILCVAAYCQVYTDDIDYLSSGSDFIITISERENVYFRFSLMSGIIIDKRTSQRLYLKSIE